MIDQHNNADDPAMEQALVVLADEMAVFVSVNAFLISSMANLISSGKDASHEVSSGAKYCADATQARALEIKESLNLMLRKYPGDRNNNAPESGRS